MSTASDIKKILHLLENDTLNTKLNDPANLSAFGEFNTIQPVPFAQVDFVYGLNTNTTRSITSNGGSVSSVNPLAVVSTGTNTAGNATLLSRRYLKYRPGQGGLARFTALFSTGVANSNQFAGVGDPSGQDGFFFGYSGNVFGIFHRRSGVNTHIPQTNWNVDKFDGSGKTKETIDPTKGNVYQIKWQYLGFGGIFFYIENDKLARFELCHIIQYSDSNLIPSVNNPSFNLFWGATNIGNNTNISVSTASGAMFSEGIVKYLAGNYGAASSANTAITTAARVLLAIRNCNTFNTFENHCTLKIKSVMATCVVTTGTAFIGFYQLFLNPVITTPTFLAIAGNSSDQGVTITNGTSTASLYTPSATDITTNAFTGGTRVYSGNVGSGSTIIFDFSKEDLILIPGDILAIVAYRSAGTGSLSCSINWSEDI